MSSYTISRIYPSDRDTNAKVDALLQAEGINRDSNLDYTCGIFDADLNLIATGSCFGNTLRCLAVSSAHQGEALMNKIVTHLQEVQYERGNLYLFLYTKCNTTKFFATLGFYEIVGVHEQVVFMENRKNGFSDYLRALSATRKDAPRVAAVVMNANPFTNGHLYLVEKASADNDILHIFLVSEDASLVPYATRKQLVLEGTAHLKNLVYHDSGPYIISNATFPSYFQPDATAVMEGHARLDLTVFGHIARTLGITRRYVGEEPFSRVTGIYNAIMAEELPKAGVSCLVIPRKTGADGCPISASTVRQALCQEDWTRLRALVPESTWRYFSSAEAIPILARMRAAGNVVHH